MGGNLLRFILLFWYILSIRSVFLWLVKFLSTLAQSMACCCLHQAIAWTGVNRERYYACYSWLANELRSLLLLLLTRWLLWHIVSCCFALLLNFYFFAFNLNVFLSFNWLMMFHKWAILSAWVCYLTQLRVFSDALWIRCTVCIEYSPIYLNHLKPWTCVYLRYTSGTALRDTRTVGRYRSCHEQMTLKIWVKVQVRLTRHNFLSSEYMYLYQVWTDLTSGREVMVRTWFRCPVFGKIINKWP